MHTQERRLTRFFCILQLIYKENRSDVFSEPKPNWTRSSSENQTETELEKSIPHIPNLQVLVMLLQ